MCIWAADAAAMEADLTLRKLVEDNGLVKFDLDLGEVDDFSLDPKRLVRLLVVAVDAIWDRDVVDELIDIDELLK